uniref:6-phosphofructokinase n=1 Tax=Timema douglasi TaxID=61478 RepID=A0A7R8VE47_TIMDO|nr:unnamed protein product [Timema douglasi]
MDPYDRKRFIERGSHKGKGIAVFTSGGDSQGMNAAVRAVVRMAIYLGCKIFFIKEGYQGMVDGGDNIVEANWASVSSIIHKVRVINYLILFGIKFLAHILVIWSSVVTLVLHWIAIDEIEARITVGCTEGEITPEQSQKYNHLHIAGLVGSIDNDFCGTDMTIGTDSALHRIIEAIDAIVSTAYSHQRTFIMEVMGRHCGYLALVAALTSEADYVFIPEWPPELDWRNKMCKKLLQARLNSMLYHYSPT